jgi:hypothetical protein
MISLLIRALENDQLLVRILRKMTTSRCHDEITDPAIQIASFPYVFEIETLFNLCNRMITI